jgi:hypothetical protein
MRGSTRKKSAALPAGSPGARPILVHEKLRPWDPASDEEKDANA